jgi:hypothetical protein
VNEVAPAGEPVDWVELKNLTGEAVDLSGWIFTDSDPTHFYAFPDGTTIGPGGWLVVARDPDTGGFDFGLGPADAVALYDSGSALVDSVSWEDGDVPPGTSWGRIPDGQGGFETLASPTPGEANVPNPDFICGDGKADLGELCDGNDLRGLGCDHAGLGDGTLACAKGCDALVPGTCAELPWTVVLNEVTASGDDAVELLNPGADAVDLSGWSLADTVGSGLDGPYVFPEGSTLGAGEYLVLLKGTHHLFGLAGEDGLVLSDDAGDLVDRVSWPDGASDVSYCRRPDGEGLFGPCEEATLGEAND